MADTNIAIWRTEFTTDPLTLGYAALVAKGDDTGLSNILNAKAYPGYVDLTPISAYCLDNGITGMVIAASDAPIGTMMPSSIPSTLEIIGACRSMLTLIETNFRLDTADVQTPAFGAGCDGLIAAGLMTSDQKTALIALGATGRSRAEILTGVDGTIATPYECSQAR